MATKGDAVEFREALRRGSDASGDQGSGGRRRPRAAKTIAVVAFAALVIAAIPTVWLISGNGGSHASQSPATSAVALGPDANATAAIESAEPSYELYSEPAESVFEVPSEEPSTSAAATAAGRPACATERYPVDPGDFGPGESPIVDTYPHKGPRAICGVVTGPRGERVPQVDISFYPVSGQSCIGCETVTDAQGRYSIPVSIGKYKVYFGLWDTLKYMGGHLSPSGGSYGDDGSGYALIDVTRADAVLNLRIQRSILVHETLVDQLGHPVQGVKCSITTQGTYYHGTSDAAGKCVVAVNQIGTFRLYFEDPSSRFATGVYGGTYNATTAAPDINLNITLPFGLPASHAPTDPPVTAPPSVPEASASA